MNRSITLYRGTTALWFALLIAALCFAALGPSRIAIVCLVLVAGLIGFQTLAFRCRSCGARPGLWLLAIWTLLLDYELYIADAVLLRRCPRCETVLSGATHDTERANRRA